MDGVMECPVCGSTDLEDLGYEDGGGDYGDELTPLFRCNTCYEVFGGPGGIRIPPEESDSTYLDALAEMADSERSQLLEGRFVDQVPSALPVVWRRFEAGQEEEAAGWVIAGRAAGEDRRVDAGPGFRMAKCAHLLTDAGDELPF